MKKRYVQFGSFIAGNWHEPADEIMLDDARAEFYIQSGQLGDKPPVHDKPEKKVSRAGGESTSGKTGARPGGKPRATAENRKEDRT